MINWAIPFDMLVVQMIVQLALTILAVLYKQKALKIQRKYYTALCS